VLRAKERAPTPYPSNVFTFGLVVESIHEFGGASMPTWKHCWLLFWNEKRLRKLGETPFDLLMEE
jgi:hypothetical protein